MELILWGTCAVLNLIVAVLIGCMIISGESAYRYVGGGWMARRSASGSRLPDILMGLLALMFAIFSLYCLSMLGWFHMPALYGVVIVVTLIYLIRGSVVVIDPLLPRPMPTFALMATWGALLMGLLQAAALIVSYLI